MAGEAVHIKLKVNFPVILFTVVLIHVLMMFSDGLKLFTLADFLPKEEPTTLKIRRVKTPRVEHPQIKPMESVLSSGAQKKSQPVAKSKPPVSLKDLSLDRPVEAREVQKVADTPKRPGTRPEVVAQNPIRGMKAISLKSSEVSRAIPSGGLAISDMMQGTQKISDAVVSIEVPEGIEPDELNKYELMFYSFQKRTALNYINSILSNLDKFQKTYPNYKIPKEARILMTARVTYDPQGNVMQIKMVRWTHINELQNLFENVVKDIDQLHNPPKALWEKQGEFSMFYTLEILNG